MPGGWTALKGVDTNRVFTFVKERTPTYVKPMLHKAGCPPRELNRLDVKNRRPLSSGPHIMLLKALEDAWDEVDAWVVLDQVSEADCGVVTHAMPAPGRESRRRPGDVCPR